MENDLSHQARILIVDDDIGTREALEQTLEDEYDIISVQNGLEAIERIKQEDFDLVLLDIMMPEIDGLETLKRIKAHDKTIDVL